MAPTFVAYLYMAFSATNVELEYIIRGIKFNIDFVDDVYTDDEEKDIVEFINSMSREIYIDKSYVDCKENKRRNTFIIETGWNSLKDLLFDSRFCRNLHQFGKDTVISAFLTLAVCYVYDCLAMKVDDPSTIHISVKNDAIFDVVVCKDTSNEWKNYIGPWQDWKFDDDGNVLGSSASESKQ